MIDVENKINDLKMDDIITSKLLDNNIIYIKDLWVLKRKDLKDIGFNDKEIKKITITLQLSGLDLNKRRYN